MPRKRYKPEEIGAKAGPRPGYEIVGCGDEDPLVVQLALDVSEKRIDGGACVPAVRGNQLVVRRHDRGFAQFHSSAPFSTQR